MLNFRKDINGLRAIAVIFVVLYHFKVPFFSGGFVGVDIFFVISGFLLTSIASHEITKGTFTRANFLAHRLRRIYPALAVVIVFCLAFGYQSYLPDDYRALVKNGFSALIVRSNYAFLGDSNYFSADSSNNILLHTWSLSLEWQFYLVFAAIFPFFFKNTSGPQPAWKNTLLISVFFISLAWCVIHTKTEQLSSFYLLPTRIWEFLAGSILALYNFKTVNDHFRKTTGIFGLSLLIYCVVFFNEKTLFPSWNALVPVLGVCLILFSKDGPVTRLLSVSPAQYIGNISYSVYLWHWPLYVITCQYYGKELNFYQISMLIVATFIFSIVSVNFIEQPFRKKISTKITLTIYVSVLMAIVLFGGLLAYTHGLPSRLPSYIQAATSAAEDRNPREKECFRDQDGIKKTPGFLCHIGVESSAPTLLLWGDSHANQIQELVSGVAQELKISGAVATHAGCPPFIGHATKNSGADLFPSCEPFANQVFSYIQKTPSINTIIVAGNWARYNTVFMHDNLESISEKLKERKIKFIFMSSIPNPLVDVPRSWAMNQKKENKPIQQWTVPLDQQTGTKKHDDDIFQFVKNNPDRNILINPFDSLCTEDGCWLVKNNQSLYVDINHLSLTGANYLRPQFIEKLTVF